MNGRTQNPSSPSPRREIIKTIGLQSNPMIPSMRISVWTCFILHMYITLRNAFEAAPRSYVASVRTTIGPMRVRNFPAVLKKQATIASCRLLFVETGDLLRCTESSSSLRLLYSSSACTQINQQQQQQHFNTFYTQKILLTYSRLSIQVFSHFPLSFPVSRSTVTPPPLLSDSSSPLLHPEACETHGAVQTQHI